jgi:hypothetical protein
MVYTTDQYQQLTAAIGQGALKVKYADKEVEYRSLAEMLRIKSLMEKDLGINNNASGRRVYATFKKGLNGECN